MDIADVTFQRPEYKANIAIWQMVNDACAGEAAVKLRAELYLPRPNPNDKTKTATDRYTQYLRRAVYYNVVGRTLAGMVGMAFNSWPTVEVPTALDYMLEDVDGSEVGIVQQSQEVLGEILKTGRAGLLVDFPPVKGPISKADMASRFAAATITNYGAASIINWRTKRQGARRILELVTLIESAEEPTGFGFDSVTQYRTLQLINGTYIVQVWREAQGSEQKEWQIHDEYIPLDASGKPWTFIPFYFVGAIRNRPEIDNGMIFGTPHESQGPNSVPSFDMMVSPLYNIATLNLAHFRNSADYEDSAFLCGQPQSWMSGLDVEWRDRLLKEGVYIGARSVLPLPQGGAFGIAQAKPNTLAKEAMEQKERQMIALGARLLEPGSAAKTATQAKFEAGKDHSVLSLACDNLSMAYSQALLAASQFMSTETPDAQFSIDTEFVVNPLDAPSITATVAAWQAGAIPITELWANLRKMGAIDPAKDDEELQEELAQEQAVRQPPALDMTEPTGGDPAALG